MKMFILSLAAGIGLASTLPGLAQSAPPIAPNALNSARTKMPKSAACTVVKAVTCKSDATCAPATAIGEIKLPMKMTVDFRNRVLLSVDNDGFPVASPIGTFAAAAGQIVLQGVDEGVGWVLHGSGADLSMSFSIASHNSVLSGFGTCEIEEDKD